MKLEDIETGTLEVKTWHEKMTKAERSSPRPNNFIILDSPVESRYTELNSSGSEDSFESARADSDHNRAATFQVQLTGLDSASVDSVLNLSGKREGLPPGAPKLDLDESFHGSQADFKLEMLMQDIMDGLEDFEREIELEDSQVMESAY